MALDGSLERSNIRRICKMTIATLFRKIIGKIKSIFIKNDYESVMRRRQQEIFRTIFKYYRKNPSQKTPERQQALAHLKKHMNDTNMLFFTHDINGVAEWDGKCYCDENGKYVLFQNRKIYYRDDLKDEKIIHMFGGLLKEQAENSPHKYLTEEIRNQNWDLIVDIGASEGIFGIGMIDKCENMILIETIDEWKACLKNTFEPWKEKVSIISAYVDEKDEEPKDGVPRKISLNTLLKGYEDKKVLIKMDIEGAETRAIKGGLDAIKKCNDCRLLVCVYHYQNEEQDVNDILKGYDSDVREGVVLYSWGDDEKMPPYFRHGVVEYKIKK